MPHERRLPPTSGPTMHPGRVDQRTRSAARKRRTAAGIGPPCPRHRQSIAPREVRRVVRQDADRTTLDPSQRRHHADAELTPELQHRVDVEQPVDHPADVVARAAGSRGSTSRSRSLVRRTPTPTIGPGSTRGTAWRPRPPRPRRRPRCRRRRWPAAPRSDRSPSGSNTPRPPPSIIAGPPMPMFESSVAITTSQQPSIAALPAKQYPDVIPTSGTVPTAQRTQRNARQSRPRHADAVGVARASAAALGEEHDG